MFFTLILLAIENTADRWTFPDDFLLKAKKEVLVTYMTMIDDQCYC